jgi:RNA polymerase sigma-70 factor (ECF subfamily)
MTDTVFSTLTPKLFAIAYRMMGSATEAEDIVQEAYLRWHNVEQSAVQSPEAYLRKTVIRLCLDAQKSAQARREVYPGVWLPEPIREDIMQPPTPAPEEQVTEWESLSMAFLLLLETLTPEERAVFLLREVFNYEYHELAGILNKTEDACRQMFSRAKKHIMAHRPRFAPSPDKHQQILASFMGAISDGNLNGLVSLLSADVTAYSDGGGKAQAFTRPVSGQRAVARLLFGLLKNPAAATATVEVMPINGQLGVILRSEALGDTVMTIGIEGDVINAIYFTRNPDKMGHVL